MAIEEVPPLTRVAHVDPSGNFYEPGGLDHHHGHVASAGYIEGLLRAHAQVHGEGLAVGLVPRPVADAAVPTVSVAPGVAIDTLGRHSWMFAGGIVTLGTGATATTLEVSTEGVVLTLPTPAATGAAKGRFWLTIEHAELRTTHDGVAVLRHAPRLRWWEQQRSPFADNLVLVAAAFVQEGKLIAVHAGPGLVTTTQRLTVTNPADSTESARQAVELSVLGGAGQLQLMQPGRFAIGNAFNMDSMAIALEAIVTHAENLTIARSLDVNPPQRTPLDDFGVLRLHGSSVPSVPDTHHVVGHGFIRYHEKNDQPAWLRIGVQPSEGANVPDTSVRFQQKGQDRLVIEDGKTRVPGSLQAGDLHVDGPSTFSGIDPAGRAGRPPQRCDPERRICKQHLLQSDRAGAAC